jgi:hypothetical protein
VSAPDDLARLYEILDEIDFARQDLLDVLDDVQTQLPPISSELARHEQVIAKVNAVAPDWEPLVPWREQRELLSDAAYERLVDFETVLSYLPRLNALHDDAVAAITAVNVGAAGAERTELARMNKSYHEKPRARPRNRMRRPAVMFEPSPR